MTGPRPFESNQWRRWHRTIEHYTPDGGLGRVLLSLVTGAAAIVGLPLAVWGIVTLTFVSVLTALIAAPLGLAAGVVTVVALWPVYLSLIGNVESAAAYPPGSASPPGADRERTVEKAPVGGSEDDEAIDVLKRRYAAGEVSQSEFERRIETLLGVDGQSADSTERQPVRELDRE